MITLCSLVAENNFVRHISFTIECSPRVVTYTNEQLSDTEHF